MLTHEQIQRLHEIRNRNGGVLRVDDVIEDASTEDSPLHEMFEWDDATAAIEHRRYQARVLIQSIKVTTETVEGRQQSVAFVRHPDAVKGEQGYIYVPEARGDPDQAHAILVREFGRVAAYLERARELAVALELQQEVEELIVHVANVRRAIVSRRPPAAPAQ